MIAEREKAGLEVSGNLGGNSYVAGIDDENMTWIIGMFTDLYSDTIRAVVREYITNARDAIIEAGLDDAVQVTLPSHLSLYFKVRDTGVGLREKDIATIYSRYGSSTKRGTNAQNGMLGVGCKAGLTYADQFTVESNKGGVKTICVVSRKQDEVPVMHVVSEQPTDEPNGTEVSIPVDPKDVHTFQEKAADILSYWEPGTVLLNGKVPDRFEGLKLTENLYVVEGRENAVVMGGVRYPVEPGRMRTSIADGHAILAFVPMGSVFFAPSREALMYDGLKGKTTLATLEAIPAQVKEAIQGAVQREVSAASAPSEAIQIVSKWSNITGTTAQVKYTWNGKDIPRSFRLGTDATATSRYGMSVAYQVEYVPLSLGYSYGRGRGGQTRRTDSIPATEWDKTCWVIGYALGKFTPQHRRKLDKWCEDNKFPQQEYTKYVLLADDSKLPREWIDPATVLDWNAINAIKLPLVQNPGSRLNGRIPGSYDCFLDGEFEKGVEASDIDQSKPVYYIVGNQQNAGYYVPVLTKHVPSYTLVMMPANRIEKFKRNFPTSIPVEQGVRDARDAWLKALTDDAKIALAIRDAGAASELSALDAEKIDDIELAVAVLDASYKDLHEVVASRKMFSNVVGLEAVTEEWENPLQKYPLYTARSLHMHPEHTYQYLNMAYAATLAAAEKKEA